MPVGSRYLRTSKTRVDGKSSRNKLSRSDVLTDDGYPIDAAVDTPSEESEWEEDRPKKRLKISRNRDTKVKSTGHSRRSIKKSTPLSDKGM